MMALALDITMNIGMPLNKETDMDDNIYTPPWGLSTLAKELSAAPSVMQSSS